MEISRRHFTKTGLLSGFVGSSLTASLIAGEGSPVEYKVQAGDTLSEIALKFGTTTRDLRQANGLTSDLIRSGQTLKVPPSGSGASTGSGGAGGSLAPTAGEHIVRSGDTLGGLAIRYGVSVSAIKTLNSLPGDVIRIGQKLKIPASASTQANHLTLVRAETAKINVRSQHWERIVVHHSGIKYGNLKKYDAAHRRRGMQNGMAYHFLIGNGIDSGDGEIEIGPRWTNQLLGGHVKSYRINLSAIGICLVGNFQATHPSRRQLEAFTQLMDWLRGEVLPNARHFAGHRELRGEQTICPGKNFPLEAMHARYDG